MHTLLAFGDWGPPKFGEPLIVSARKNFKLRVSNPSTIAYVHFNMPCESSDVAGAGPCLPDL